VILDPTTAIVVQTLADDWLAELEIIAVGEGAVQRVRP
jgi:hypothetical protein